MERVNRILSHPLFLEQFALLQKAEENRIFCRHTMEHFLDVARLTYLFYLEDQIPCQKDIIYGAAMLHDIGRFEQMKNGMPHHIAGAKMSEKILPDCGYHPEEIRMIAAAILGHRNHPPNNAADAYETYYQPELSEKSAELLTEYLYRADKMSRNCFSCSAAAECNWPEDRKNNEIQY